jgi:uncharacterized membrane protein YedE/YeeE
MIVKQSVAMTILRKEYHNIFVENWSSQTGGILIALTSIITFAWARPWGVVGGIRSLGDWFFYWIGIYEGQPSPVLTSSSFVLTLGLLWGALAAALMAKQFAIRVPPRLELIKGAVGGGFLGLGAALAGGCTVGGFYSSIGALSLSGVTMLAGLLIGAYLGLKYLYWELEHLPAVPDHSAKVPSNNSRADRKSWQPILGLGLIFLAFWGKEIYSLNGYIVIGGLLLCGIAFGFILHRSRFCFASCFRDPFMTGDTTAIRAVVMSLMISTVGLTVIKWIGLRGELSFVSSSFGLGGLVGGIIFGFGMLLTGGCGSGAIWRVAEGQVKLLVALATFALSNSLAKTVIRSTESIQILIGWKMFLPDLFGYPLSVFYICLIMMLWYLAATWNEEGDYFVIQM